MTLRSDLREGRDLGAPFCCRLRWALEYALNPDGEQSVKRGVRVTTVGDEYIPCGVFHQAHYTHAEYEELLNTPGTPIYARGLEITERDARP
jgi:hypothetical protein